jgi:glycosyltransferase involved in cell wall biosynthesis
MSPQLKHRWNFSAFFKTPFPVKKMTILIRPTPDDGWVGGAIYFRNLINSIELAAGESGEEVELVIVYEDGAHLPAVDRLLPERLKRVFFSDYEDIELTPEDRQKLQQLPQGLERRQYRHAVQYDDLIKATDADLIFPYFPNGPHRPSCAILSWIPDLQHVGLPEFFSEEEIETRDRKYQNAATYSDAVILSSESAREDFSGRFGGEGTRVDILRFYTLPEAAWYEPDFTAVRDRFGIAEDYFMVCNQFWAHKNHLAVVEALKILKSQGQEPMIVFTGGVSDHRRPGVIDGVLQSLCEAGLWSQVRLLGQLSRLDQIQLLRGARAVVQPSLFEGWSTVLEDCRTLGQDLIASRLRVHLEQDIPGARYFDPRDPAELAGHLSETMALPRPYSAEREETARHAAEGRAMECGRTFLRLAREICRERQ